MKKFPYKIVLGSQSPRRKELLAALNLKFTVKLINSGEETYPQSLAKEDIPSYLAIKKALAYKGSLEEDELLITADTVVVLGDKVLGKPCSKEDAFQMLEALSGKQHSVITGVVFMLASGKGTFVSAKSDVTFSTILREEISFYVENFKPFDKAGSYGIQEWLGYAKVTRIDGSFYNIMGLPTDLVHEVLAKWLDKEKELVSLTLDF